MIDIDQFHVKKNDDLAPGKVLHKYFVTAVYIQGRFVFQFSWYFLAAVTIQGRFIFKGGL